MVLLASHFRYAVSMVVIIFVLLKQTCSAKHHPSCPSSSCGKIRNISYPFRLKGDHRGCGLQRYELECLNNVTVLTLSAGKYHVQEIDYKRYQIRVTDAGVVEDTPCYFPRYFLFRRNISDNFDVDTIYTNIAFLNCSNPVTDDPRYVRVDRAPCNSGGGGYVYAVWQYHDYPGLRLSDIKVGCRLKVVTLTNIVTENLKASYADVRKSLSHGFLLSWLFPVVCREQCGKGVACYLNKTAEQVQCVPRHFCTYVRHFRTKCGLLPRIYVYIRTFFLALQIVFHDIISGLWSRITFHKMDANYIQIQYIGQNVLPILLVFRYLLGVTLLLGLLIYKWRRRHLSMYESIESFLFDKNLYPIRYEYKEIKKMTKGFKVKLGQGGFGSVYKGKLQSGSNVAIKMLSKSKSNGQEFISEVATIGRIHHVNVVRLIGYCVEGKKCALVYEYMPNGSLDKYIFSKEGNVLLSYAKTYEIALGIAHAIAYLHQGCDMQILHFDIKPHNILLDDNFIPKVSDFGLAKLYPVNNSIVTLTAARGTLGYMAPELFYQNVGRVSYKADVYSFGMLLMEMTSRRKNSNPCVERSSQEYFPLWIYDQFKEEKVVDMEDVSEEDKMLTKRMFIVALWCIQLKPVNRPSMNKVVEMLEGKIESLEMPPKPSFYPHEMTRTNTTFNLNQTTWSDSSSLGTNVDECQA